jgi:chemosensory pili system protein ChpA (sensor histidine kinase/response regulator)
MSLGIWQRQSQLLRAPAAATVPAAELSTVDLDGDDELLSIFLEEAREVVDNGLQALRRWRTSPAI